MSEDKMFLCKYKVNSFVITNKAEKIILDHSNILSIEYHNDYEFNIMALMKVSLRIDVRRRLWILKNKKDIKVKLEVNKIGYDDDTEKFVTGEEKLWNLECVPHFNDDDESMDITDIEQRLKLNEGEDFKSNNIDEENLFETQNILDLYLFNPTLLKASRTTYNKIFTKDTLQNMVGRLLCETNHKDVLMSKFDNFEIYQELLLPANPAYKCLMYMDQYYGFYKKGALIYYDIDTLYILNSNGVVTAKRENEWPQSVFIITNISESMPGNGMIRKPGEKVFYMQISEMDINPQKFTIAKNVQLGSEAKIVITDDTEIQIDEADQSFIDKRNQNLTFIKKDNKYAMDIVKQRMEENEAIIYISGDNFDISAFTPNKEFKLVFMEPSKQKKYGGFKYRMSYAYHYIKIQAEGYMNSSHRIILKKCAK